MNSFLKHASRIGALVSALLYGSAAAAQNFSAVTDEQLQERVKAAMHADRFFFDRHIDVSVNNGVVVLRGLVFSDWDMRDALRIARAAAGDNLVVNSLTLIQGGRR
jgi:osmotically-inducible protein OsmY